MNTKQDCPDCGGEGSTFEDVWLGDHGHSTRHYRCETCEGTGRVDAEPDEDGEDEPTDLFLRVAAAS